MADQDNKFKRIDINKPYFELKSFDVTLDICQTFTQIKKAFADCSQHRFVSVWIMEKGLKYRVPLTALVG